MNFDHVWRFVVLPILCLVGGIGTLLGALGMVRETLRPQVRDRSTIEDRSQ